VLAAAIIIATALRKLVRTVLRFVVITGWLNLADRNDRDVSITWDGSDAIRVDYIRHHPSTSSVTVATVPALVTGKAGKKRRKPKKSGTPPNPELRLRMRKRQ
jgi:hypothetical protein